jgi:hypothetical protein
MPAEPQKRKKHHPFPKDRLQRRNGHSHNQQTAVTAASNHFNFFSFLSPFLFSG